VKHTLPPSLLVVFSLPVYPLRFFLSRHPPLPLLPCFFVHGVVLGAQITPAQTPRPAFSAHFFHFPYFRICGDLSTYQERGTSVSFDTDFTLYMTIRAGGEGDPFLLFFFVFPPVVSLPSCLTGISFPLCRLGFIHSFILIPTLPACSLDQLAGPDAPPTCLPVSCLHVTLHYRPALDSLNHSGIGSPGLLQLATRTEPALPSSWEQPSRWAGRLAV